VIDRIVLVGFMCAGKTTVGRRLAQQLGWQFLDFDRTIEEREGRRIADIFREDGENHFRGLEARLTEEAQDRKRFVLAPGGGWVTQPELVDRLRPGSLFVWLRVQPETVYARQRVQKAVERPLLGVEHPLDTIRTILADRVGLYRQADAVVDTDGRDPDDVVADIVEILNRGERVGS
jgi:shikimate kinase